MKKKFLLLASCILLLSNVYAQIPYSDMFSYLHHADEIRALKASRPAINNNNRSIFSMYLDYDAANFDNKRYVWKFNSLYTVPANDTGTAYAAVAFDQIAGYTDPNDIFGTFTDWISLGYSSKLPASVVITFDSVFAVMTHENNSGLNDSIDFKLITTNASHAPTSTSSTLWSGGFTTNATLSPGGNWVGTGAALILFDQPNYTTTAGQTVALQFSYYDPTKMDTAAIDAGFVQGATTGYPDSVSHYHNSYFKYLPYRPNITPNFMSGLTSGGHPFAAQNYTLWARVTINDGGAGINDNFNNLIVHSVTPNPASGEATVYFGLDKNSNVVINLLDLSGKNVKTLFNENSGAGAFLQKIDLSDVNSGMYLVSVQADNGTPVISKIVVTH